jgi:hypothetical protein
LKKLPALPSTAGSGSLRLRIARTARSISIGAGQGGLVGELGLQFAVGQHRAQAAADAKDQFQHQPALAAGPLEDAVAVAEAAVGPREMPDFATVQVDRAQRVEALADLESVRADVLDHGRAGAARDHREVLESGQPLAQRPLHGGVPGLAGLHPNEGAAVRPAGAGSSIRARPRVRTSRIAPSKSLANSTLLPPPRMQRA